MSDLEAPVYWAFISYAHSDDSEPGRRWATWLHQAIEHYEIPSDLIGTKNRKGEPIPEQIYPVFRDTAELSASSDLSEQLRAALRGSRHLITICSPRALQSTHVIQEIAYFKSIGKEEHIHAVIVDGSPNSSNSENPEDWNTECFVPSLRFAVNEAGELTDKAAEPFAADLRAGSRGGPRGQGWTTAQAYRDHLKKTYPELSIEEVEEKVFDYRERLDLALLKIIAAILDVPLRDLTERNQVYQLAKAKRRSRIIARVAAFMSLLAILAIVAGVLAVKHERVARINEGKALLNQAKSHLGAGEYPSTQIVAARALGFYGFDGESTWSENGSEKSLLPNTEPYSKLVSKLERIASGLVSAPFSPLPVWCSPAVEIPDGHSDNPIWAVDFSADFRWVISGAEDGKVRVYSWNSPKKQPRILPHPGPNHQAVRDLKISPSGDWLAVAFEAPPGEKDFVAIWKIEETGSFVPKFSKVRVFTSDQVSAIDWSPDSLRLVTAGGANYGDGMVELWLRDSSAGAPIFSETIPERWLHDVSWSPSGESIAIAGHQTVQLIDPKNGTLIGDPLKVFGDETAFTTISFSDTGEFLSAGTTAREIFVWRRTNQGYQVQIVKSGHAYPLRDIIFTPGGTNIISSSADGNIRVWGTEKLPEMNLQASLLGDSSKQSEKFPSIRALATSPDGNFLLTGLFDGGLRLWSMGQRERLTLAGPGNVECLSIDSDSRLLVTGRESVEGKANTGIFTAIDLEKETVLWRKEFPIAPRSGFALRLESQLIEGENLLLTFHRQPRESEQSNYINLYDARSGSLLDSTAYKANFYPRVAAFSESGNCIILSNKEGECFAAHFDPSTRQLPEPDDFTPIIHSRDGLSDTDIWDITLSPDGNLAALVGRHKLRSSRMSFVHVMNTIDMKTTVRTNVGPNVAMCVDFHPDGSRLAVGTYDRRLIYILDSATGQQLGSPLRGHSRSITALRYNHDGSKLASGSMFQVRIWNMKEHDEIAALFAHENIVQDFAWERGTKKRHPRLVSGAEEVTLKFWPLRDEKPNLKSYFANYLGKPAWLVFNSDDATLGWNTTSHPHPGFINLPPQSSIGRLHRDPADPETIWHLYIDSIRAGNWQSAIRMHAQLKGEQLQKKSFVVDQCVRQASVFLDQLASLPEPPEDFIRRRNAQLQIVSPERIEPGTLSEL